MKKFLPAAAAALFLAGCTSVSDASFTFSGNIQNLNQAPAETPTIEIQNIANSVLAVRGGVTTPCWNDFVRIDGDKNGNTLIAEVSSIPQQPCTDARVRHHLYLGVFSGLRAGTYTVRVVNSIGGTPNVELETQVQVQ